MVAASKTDVQLNRVKTIPIFGSKTTALFEHTGGQRPDFAIEPDDGQESVWDYPRPPSLKPDSRLVEVRSGTDIIARTHRAFRLCETASPPTFYLPPTDVNTDKLLPARGASVCEWKGKASYWALLGNTNEPVAWTYASPRARYRKIRNYFAFYPARLECFVDGERVEPQPGRFYGGWITSDVVGPFKGEPGTGHW